MSARGLALVLGVSLLILLVAAEARGQADRSQSLPPAAAPALPGNAVGEALALTAASYESVRYGELLEGQRFDCSGLVQRVFAIHGAFLPRSAAEQARVGVPVRWRDLRAGDVVFFSAEPGSDRVTHVGIVAASRRVVHASTSRLRVVIDRLDTTYFRQHFVVARRVLGTGQAARVALR